MNQSHEQADGFSFDASSRTQEIEYRCARLAEALRELKDLLDQYSPAWYTELHYEKASSALELLASSAVLNCEPEQQVGNAVVRS